MEKGGRGVGRVRLRLDVQGQGRRRILDVDGQKGEESWKLDNFHGRRMCIIPDEKILKAIKQTR